MESVLRSFDGTARFKLVRLLGRGGMGVVYEALDQLHQHPVALKLLPLVNPDRLLRFKREFRAVAEIDHPNLVRLGELVGVGERWFFTMELIHGTDIVTYVRGSGSHTQEATLENLEASVFPAAAAGAARPPLPDERRELRLRSALPQLAQALSTLHAHGCVHCDLKPSNVLVTDQERVVLLDFGLASAAGWESTAVQGGTPLYMAPEQASGEPVGPAADWYAFGAVLFELLTGVPPFSGASQLVLMAKQSAAVPRVHALAPDAQRDLAELCEALLQREPDARLTGDEVLRALAVAASETRVSWTSLLDEQGTLVGREREWSALQRACDEVAEARSARVEVLRGDSGIGKSTLVRAFCEAQARRGQALVLQGRCHERELLPFKAVDGVFDALAHWLKHRTDAELAAVLPARAGVLAQVFPVLARVSAIAHAEQPALDADPTDVRAWLFSAVRELSANIAHGRRLILYIDDLQWADQDSIALLTEVLRAPPPAGVLLLCTLRTRCSELESAIERVFPAGIDERHSTLEPLSAADTRKLAERFMTALGQPADVDRLTAESGGHPLFLQELLRGAAEHGLPSEDLTLEGVLRARAGRLRPEPARVLQLLAVAGAPLAREVLRTAAELDPDRFVSVVHELRSARLAFLSARPGEERLEIAHDRVRLAVHSALTPEAERGVNLRLAEALEKAGDAFGAAAHFHAAGEHARASRHYATCGKRAMDALAFADAIGHYQTALELAEWPLAERRALVIQLADALSNAGRGAAAAQHYRQAAASAAEASIDLRRRAAEELMRAGYLDEGLGVCREVLADAGMEMAKRPLQAQLLERALLRLRGTRFTLRKPEQLSPRELAKIDLCWSLSSGLILTDYVQGAYFQTRGMALALRSGDAYRIARSLAAEAAYRAAMGAPEADSRELFDVALRLGQDLQSTQVVGIVALMEGISHHFVGRFAPAREHLQRADSTLRGRVTGAIWELDACRQFWLESLYYLGELAPFTAATLAGIREAGERGSLYTATNLRTGLTNALWLLADQPERARKESAEAIQRWPATGFHVQHWYALIADVQSALYEDRDDAAHALMEARWAELKRSHLLLVTHMRVVAYHLRGRAALCAARHAQRDARAPLLDLAVRCARKLASQKQPWSHAFAACLEAGIGRLRAGAPLSEAQWNELARALDAAALPLYRDAVDVLRLGPTSAAWTRLEGQQVKQPERWARMLLPGV